MILVMGGTSEARELVDSLDVSQIIYTTATRNPAHLTRFRQTPKINLIGRLDRARLVGTIKDHDIKKLIDATHPFAVDASQNAIAACRECRIPYIRLERPPVKIPETGLVRLVSDFNEAARVVGDMEGAKRILLSIGVNNLKFFQELIDDAEREVYCQVLDIPESLELAGGHGIPLDRVLSSQGVPTMENVHRMLMDFGLDMMVFKESGYRGGTDAKIEAGLITKTPMVLIDRPKIDYPKVYDSLEELVCFIGEEK